MNPLLSMPTAEQVMRGDYTPGEAHLVNCLQWAIDYIENEKRPRATSLNDICLRRCREAVASRLAGIQRGDGRPDGRLPGNIEASAITD